MKKLLKPWASDRIAFINEIHPRFASSLVMMGAASVSALVAISYAKAIDLVSEIMTAFSIQNPKLFIASSPFCFLVAWATVYFFAPEGAGSGIPQVLAKIERASSPHIVAVKFSQNLKLIVVKMLSSIAAVLGGGAIGREGPTIQISAAIFVMFDSLFKKYVRYRCNRESLLIAGGAAGLAAAFNTPLGGVVFAIEELANEHFKNFKGILILTVVTAGYVTQAIIGPYLFLGHPSIGPVTALNSLIGLGTAIIVGLAGSLFGVVLFRTVLATKRLTIPQRILVAAVVALVMSSMCVMLGPNASGGGGLLIKDLLFQSQSTQNEIGWPIAIWRMVGVILTYATGCAGGIFAPSLAAGAALGSVISHTFISDNHNLIVVLGMISFLTGVTRSPFTCFILVFEMTDRQAAIMPMLTAALVANIIALFVEKEGLYEKLKNVILATTVNSK